VTVVGAKKKERGYLDAALSALWNEPAEKPTALFTVSDAGAWAAMDWLYRQGLDVPGDVSVLGFENVPTSRFTRPALTTVAHPVAEIAARAIDALWSERYDPHRHELVEPHLVVRNSTGSVPA
jgi:DNA-binding LacI/PurR family transcriptional regulator